MTGIPRAITEHRLDTYPHIEPKVQKKRSLAPDRKKVVTDEVNEWHKAGIVRRVRYPSWVANPVLVKKVDRSWRMCINFKDLNKACPKDLYPLPEIDWKIESLMGFKYKCFLDAYKGYHQIHMTKNDEEKTAFHTEEGVFCYTKMPFGLKNAGATYQRLVDSAFKEQIWVNPEAYVDDMVIVETEAAEAAFLEMKKLVSKLATLTTPKKGGTLMIYLVVVDKELYRINYVSRSLQGAETNYALMEKLTLALVHAARRLRRLYTDGASNNEGSGAGQILIALDDVEYSYVLRLNFSNSNNDAEYEALLTGLRIAMEMQVKDINASVDSKLVASQAEGSYEVTDISQKDKNKANGTKRAHEWKSLRKEGRHAPRWQHYTLPLVERTWSDPRALNKGLRGGYESKARIRDQGRSSGSRRLLSSL
ncbi:reverse transcriptase domain-containing protein [Tanacetum coccineum]